MLPSEKTTVTATTDLAPFNPNALLDALLHCLQLKNDAALSRSLNVAPPMISKIRHGRIPIGASILIRMHEESGLSIQELRNLMGDRRVHYRGYGTQSRSGQKNSVRPASLNGRAGRTSVGIASEP